MADTPLTEKQSAFLDALFEAEGNVALACDTIGISKVYGYSLVKSLKEVIIARAEEVLALHAPKAAFAMAGVLHGDTAPNQNNILEAARQVLDRVGLVKKDKVQLDVNAGAGLFILPARRELDD